MPAEQSLCIEGWKTLHPDWEFILWDEKNSPMDMPYLQTAVKNKKWANLSNYIRLFALKNHGGIYMDTDFKLIKELTPLLDNDCFFGFEEANSATNVFWLNNALCGAEKNHAFINACCDELLSKYDGSEESNLSSPKLVTELMIREKGLTEYKDQVLDGIRLYPIEYFYPIHYSEAYKVAEFEKYVFPETIAVHLWARSWIDKSVLIETIDHLTYKTNSQEKYINELKELTVKLEAKADEIYYWKQHFETEFNKLNAAAEDINKLNFRLDDIADKIAGAGTTLSEISTVVQGLANKMDQLPVSFQQFLENDREQQMTERNIDREKTQEYYADMKDEITNLKNKINSINISTLFINKLKRKKLLE
jgi:uncharacterized protein YoxC